jgi:hypothetical protein
MLAQDICYRAGDLVGGEKRRQHGDPEAVHAGVAALWSTYLGHRLTAHDVAILMILLKVARTTTGTHNIDDYIDIAGYAGIAAKLAADA